LNQSSNIPTIFGDDWSNSKDMATVFRNSKMAATAILNFPNYAFPTSPMLIDLNQSSCIPTKVDDDRLISNEMAAVFQNARWRLRKQQILI